MAKQTGTLQVSGDVGNIGFFQRKGKAYARRKTTLNKRRIAADPAFERTRENMSEFGEVAAAMKLLRNTIRPLLNAVSDGEAANRLHKTLSQIKNLDVTTSRGMRRVASGLQLADGRKLLEGFDFNSQTQLSSVLAKPWVVDPLTGTITIEHLVPADHIVFAPGSTHVSLRGAYAAIDFNTADQDIVFTNTVMLPRGLTETDVELTPPVLPAAYGSGILFLLVCFYQEMGGAQYLLKNGAHNALCIVKVV